MTAGMIFMIAAVGSLLVALIHYFAAKSAAPKPLAQVKRDALLDPRPLNNIYEQAFPIITNKEVVDGLPESVRWHFQPAGAPCPAGGQHDWERSYTYETQTWGEPSSTLRGLHVACRNCSTISRNRELMKAVIFPGGLEP